MSRNHSTKTCSFPGCEKKHKSFGLCSGHLMQKKKGRELTPLKKQRERGSPPSPCSFPGCDKPAIARGLCNSHHMQEKRGKPLVPLYQTYRKAFTPPKIEYDEVPCPNEALKGPCHIFRGCKACNGYGKVSVNGKLMLVHRYVWIEANGPIPEDLEIDHQCRNRGCCNVDHLRLVTHKVNCTENVVGVMWQIHQAKTHCKNGHLFDEKSIKIKPNGKVHRICPICKREANRRIYARNREEKKAIDKQNDIG